jgi:predicted ABC-type ATPase
MPDEANEFFYLDSAGTKQDADLHNAILNPVDFPVEEKIMAPIRERNRAKYQAELDKQRAEQKAVRDAAKLKSQWARTKARAQALLKYDPSEPRDDAGKWTSGGGGGGEGESPPFEHADGRPAKTAPSKSPHAKDPTSASALLKVETDVTVGDLHKLVPGSAEQSAVAEAKIAKDGQETKTLYQLPNGHYAPDRLPTQLAVRDSMVTPEQLAAAQPARGERPTLYILGGRGGSGKGWFTGPKGTLAGIKSKAVYINNDDAKEAFPEYEGWNAGVVHEEASDVAEGLEKYVRDNHLNVVIDATLKSEGSLLKRIEQYKAAGYKISGHYMYASPATAAKRALQRFVGGNEETGGKGRYIRPQYSMGSLDNEHNFDNNRDKMDYWEVYDNMGKSPKLHSKKGD